MNLQEATEYLLTELSKENAPHIILLKGDLGAGKTHFVNIFAQQINILQRLPSPTFTFLQEYPCAWQQYKKLIHCDFYRVEKEQSTRLLEQIGFWDYVQPNNLVFIEWPERVPELQMLPHYTLMITLHNQQRTYEFST